MPWLVRGSGANGVIERGQHMEIRSSPLPVSAPDRASSTSGAGRAGALVPDAQVLLDPSGRTRIDIALFRARPKVGVDSAVLIVQRSRR